MEHLWLPRRATDGTGQQGADPRLKDHVGGETDGIPDPLGLQQLVESGANGGSATVLMVLPACKHAALDRTARQADGSSSKTRP